MILVSQEVHRRLQDIYQFEAMPDVESDGKTKVQAWRLAT
jgi:hypothetical protein